MITLIGGTILQFTLPIIYYIFSNIIYFCLIIPIIYLCVAYERSRKHLEKENKNYKSSSSISYILILITYFFINNITVNTFDKNNLWKITLNDRWDLLLGNTGYFPILMIGSTLFISFILYLTIHKLKHFSYMSNTNNEFKNLKRHFFKHVNFIYDLVIFACALSFVNIVCGIIYHFIFY